MTFDSDIKEYVEKTTPCLHILSICNDDSCHVQYTTSLMGTLSICKQYGVNVSVIFHNTDSCVPRARNNLIAKSMSNPNITHMMLIDTNIQWNPYDVLKMLLNNKMIVGGICPNTHYAWEKIIQTESMENVCKQLREKNPHIIPPNIPNDEIIQNRIMNYSVAIRDGPLTVEDNVTDVDQFGLGFVLIHRRVIETLQQAFPSTFYRDSTAFLKTDEEKKHAYALFEQVVENGEFLTQDEVFCRRWKNVGGAIYANITLQLNRIGSHKFNGQFLRSII